MDTRVVCSECGEGNFVEEDENNVFECTVCLSEVTWLDFEGNGAVGERVVMGSDGFLIVVTEDES